MVGGAWDQRHRMFLGSSNRCSQTSSLKWWGNALSHIPGTPPQREEKLLYGGSVMSSRTWVLPIFCCYLECVNFVLRMSPSWSQKGCPRSSHPSRYHNVQWKKRYFPPNWDTLPWEAFPRSPWSGSSLHPMPNLIDGRGVGLSILTCASQGCPLGLGLASLKHRSHVGRRTPEHNQTCLRNRVDIGEAMSYICSTSATG